MGQSRRSFAIRRRHLIVVHQCVYVGDGAGEGNGAICSLHVKGLLRESQ